ncbi:endolysin [Brochothrix phage BtpYZU02]|nr:endolysin [Brochothrix phage BtpYZU02]
MVKVINKSVCRGVAGKRVGNVKGVVIHNTWDNNTAESHIERLGKMNNEQLEAGYGHYYVDEDTIARVEDTFNKAWHTANTEGNAYYIGIEVRGNRQTPKEEFEKAEQNAFKQAYEDLKYYKLPINRNTVRLHCEFTATECPKRSLIEHCGYDSTNKQPQAVIDKLKDYFIAQIKKCGNTETVKPPVTPKPPAAVKSPVKHKPPVKPQEIKRVAEKGTFYPNTTVAIKHTPTIKAKQEATLGKGESVIYDRYVKSDGYVWVSYIRNNGKRGYACSRDVKTGKAFGTFK